MIRVGLKMGRLKDLNGRFNGGSGFPAEIRCTLAVQIAAGKPLPPLIFQTFFVLTRHIARYSSTSVRERHWG
jgi:hypothetical protein